MTQGTFNHDKNMQDFIPFVKEAQFDIRDFWDYKSGQPLTKDVWRQYLKANPRSRLGRYTDEDNAIWLMNKTAYNPVSTNKIYV